MRDNMQDFHKDLMIWKYGCEKSAMNWVNSANARYSDLV
jgi:hypothetical protein